MVTNDTSQVYCIAVFIASQFYKPCVLISILMVTTTIELEDYCVGFLVQLASFYCCCLQITIIFVNINKVILK